MIENTYSTEELLAHGFSSVGEGASVSRDARLFAISGTLGDGVRVDAFSILTGHIVLAEGVHISPMCFLAGTGGRIEMQAHSGLASHVSVYTKSDDYRAESTEEADKTIGDVFVGRRSIIGSGSKIMPGVHIAAQVSVGCNCVVNQNLEQGSIVISRATSLVTVAMRG